MPYKIKSVKLALDDLLPVSSIIPVFSLFPACYGLFWTLSGPCRTLAPSMRSQRVTARLYAPDN